MLGIIMVVIGTILVEVTSSSGKLEISQKKESLYTYGFLCYFWPLIIFLIIILIKGHFIFNTETLPLFILLIILEVAQVYSSLHAVAESERSTFGFLMVLTIPLILLVDLFLGYQISIFSLIGICLIVISLLFLFINHGLSKKGIRFVLFSSINGAITISVFKYLISNNNSVESLQFISCLVIVTFLFILSLWKNKENPIKSLFKKEFLLQSFSIGLGTIFVNFAYLYAPASIITGAKRGTSVLASIVSGNKFFHEKHLLIKILSFFLIVFGLILLIL